MPGRALRLLAVASVAWLLTVLPHPLAPDDSAEAAAKRGHVYLIRGIGNVFSLGMDSLGAKLEAKGVRESVSNHLTWSRLADKVIAEYKADKKLAPIIIVGHSLGGNAALLVASKLIRGYGTPKQITVPHSSI